jgi:hypothetical protein
VREIEPGTSESAARNTDHQATEAVDIYIYIYSSSEIEVTPYLSLKYMLQGACLTVHFNDVSYLPHYCIILQMIQRNTSPCTNFTYMMKPNLVGSSVKASDVTSAGARFDSRLRQRDFPVPLSVIRTKCQDNK